MCRFDCSRNAFNVSGGGAGLAQFKMRTRTESCDHVFAIAVSAKASASMSNLALNLKLYTVLKAHGHVITDATHQHTAAFTVQGAAFTVQGLTHAVHDLGDDVCQPHKLKRFLSSPAVTQHLVVHTGYCASVLPFFITKTSNNQITNAEWDLLESRFVCTYSALPSVPDAAPQGMLADADDVVNVSDDEEPREDVIARLPDLPDDGSQIVAEVNVPGLEKYTQMSREQLLVHVLRQDQTISNQKNKIKVLTQQARRSKEKLDSACADLATSRQQSEQDLALEKYVSRFTPKGLTSLAVRRNLSNISASDLSSVLTTDFSGHTVIRAERMLAASLTAHSRHVHQEAHCNLIDGSARLLPRVGSAMSAVHLTQPAPDVDFQIVAHAIRSDATNSSVWQNSKLYATQVSS
jgi:hypothetical protein